MRMKLRLPGGRFPVVRTIITALLAGISGALFGGLAAALLKLSVGIAATVSGVSLAMAVAALTYRHLPGRTA